MTTLYPGFSILPSSIDIDTDTGYTIYNNHRVIRNLDSSNGTVTFDIDNSLKKMTIKPTEKILFDNTEITDYSNKLNNSVRELKDIKVGDLVTFTSSDNYFIIDSSVCTVSAESNTITESGLNYRPAIISVSGYNNTLSITSSAESNLLNFTIPEVEGSGNLLVTLSEGNYELDYNISTFSTISGETDRVSIMPSSNKAYAALNYNHVQKITASANWLTAINGTNNYNNKRNFSSSGDITTTFTDDYVRYTAPTFTGDYYIDTDISNNIISLSWNFSKYNEITTITSSALTKGMNIGEFSVSDATISLDFDQTNGPAIGELSTFIIKLTGTNNTISVHSINIGTYLYPCTVRFTIYKTSETTYITL